MKIAPTYFQQLGDPPMGIFEGVSMRQPEGRATFWLPKLVNASRRNYLFCPHLAYTSFYPQNG
jgi:hypothetical protein